LEHNIADNYFRFGNLKKANEYLQKAISKGKNLISDYIYGCYCSKAHL